jgi:hypothetical protein
MLVMPWTDVHNRYDGRIGSLPASRLPARARATCSTREVKVRLSA